MNAKFHPGPDGVTTVALPPDYTIDPAQPTVALVVSPGVRVGETALAGQLATAWLEVRHLGSPWLVLDGHVDEATEALAVGIWVGREQMVAVRCPNDDLVDQASVVVVFADFCRDDDCLLPPGHLDHAAMQLLGRLKGSTTVVQLVVSGSPF